MAALQVHRQQRQSGAVFILHELVVRALADPSVEQCLTESSETLSQFRTLRNGLCAARFFQSADKRHAQLALVYLC